MSSNMNYGASRKLFQIARTLRRNMTQTEQLLWEKLCNKRLNGLKFRRQHPIHRYIVDFYCHQLKLIIELDGSYHISSGQRLYDEFRDEEMNQFGLTVLRFTDNQILSDMEGVIYEISQYTNKL